MEKKDNSVKYIKNILDKSLSQYYEIGQSGIGGPERQTRVANRNKDTKSILKATLETANPELREKLQGVFGDECSTIGVKTIMEALSIVSGWMAEVFNKQITTNIPKKEQEDESRSPPVFKTHQKSSPKVIVPKSKQRKDEWKIIVKETPEMLEGKINEKMRNIEKYIAEWDYSSLELAKNNCGRLKNMKGVTDEIITRISERVQEIDGKYKILVEQFDSFVKPDKEVKQEEVGNPKSIPPRNVNPKTGRPIDDFW